MRVALHFQSNRISTVRGPLEAIGVETVRYEDAVLDYDAVICDSPGLLSDHIGESAPVVLRLRGDMWAERGHSTLAKPVMWAKDQLLASICDGVVTPDERLNAMLERRTHVGRTAVVGLPVTLSDWPSVRHDASALRCLTLTNLDYQEKIEPLYAWADVAEKELGSGERWRICGDGEHAKEFAQHVSDMAHVEYAGFQDASEELAAANVLLHPSAMDIQMPNAILEGVASNLPVVTTDFEPFVTNPAVAPVSTAELPATLADLRDADRRERLAADAREYVSRRHHPHRIGHKYRSFLEGLL